MRCLCCLHVVLVIAMTDVVSLFNITIFRDASQQLRIDTEFATAGVDSFNGSSVRARHTVFVGTSAQARQMGSAYRRKIYSMNTSSFIPFDVDTNNQCPPSGIKCNPKQRYRTIDGSCNNLEHPTWGQALTPLRRFLQPQYDDGVSTPRTKSKVAPFSLPSARLVSTTVHSPDDNVPKLGEISHMVMQFGQFLDHDITLAPIRTGLDGRPLTCCEEDIPHNLQGVLQPSLRDGCFPIEIPPGDRRFNRTCMNFPRSIQVDNAKCTGVPSEQLNQLTAYIDGSQVYGSSEEEMTALRTFSDGMLKESKNRLLPNDKETLEVCSDSCFKAGDERVNEQMGLVSIHTLFVREHNRLARALKSVNPHWRDERLFQEARKIVGGMLQAITYNDFLPLVLNKEIREECNLISEYDGFDDIYEDDVDPSIRNAFQVAAYRFGHSMLRTIFSRFRPTFSLSKQERLRDLFGNTALIRSSNGEAVNEILRGQTRDRASKVDRFMTRELTDFLFGEGPDSMDLASLNIQRGRDHGAPGYVEFREFCDLSEVSSFNDLVDHAGETIVRLMQVYRDVRDIDLFSGGLSEIPVPGSLVGPTFSCILAKQFSVLKKGDRFWHELPRRTTGFSPAQLHEIRKASLARIICDNTNTFFIQPNVFILPLRRNRPRSCGSRPRIDIRKWRERVPFHRWTPWTPWTPCRLFVRFSFSRRYCLPFSYGCIGRSLRWRRCPAFSSRHFQLNRIQQSSVWH